MAFNNFPYGDFQDLNLDWILRKIGELSKKVNAYDSGIQNAVNEKLDELMREGKLAGMLTPFGFGGFVFYHLYRETGDTSWFLIKIPKSAFKLSFHNCSGNDSATPTTLASDPEEFLKNYSDGKYFLAHNCNFGGMEWGSRWNGINYPRDIPSGTTPRPYFAFNSVTEECAFFESNVMVSQIPAEYDVVFACGDWFVLDGNARGSEYSGLDDGLNPRTCFGWDDDSFYVFCCEGRGTYETGLRLDEVKQIFVSFGVRNAVCFDGGGSVCVAANIAGGTRKINHFRDVQRTYNKNRAVGLCACYERREVNE